MPRTFSPSPTKFPRQPPQTANEKNHRHSPPTDHAARRPPPATMKLNISYPANGSQKLLEVDDDRRLRVFMDRRMGHEVPADSLGDEWKGYVLRITGGNDKQGFPMKQGVMHPTRVRLLLSAGHSCYRPRRTGERRRKSVRGCIVAMDLAVLALAVVRQGEGEIQGLTDVVHPKRLGPKRAGRIRKMFGLTKEDDVSLAASGSCCSSRPVADVTRREFTGPQVRRPPRGPAQEGGRQTLHQSHPHPAPRHPPASAAQAPSPGTQASSFRGSEGGCRTFLPPFYPNGSCFPDRWLLTVHYPVRIRRSPAQACLRREGQEGRGEKAPGVVDAQVIPVSSKLAGQRSSVQVQARLGHLDWSGQWWEICGVEGEGAGRSSSSSRPEGSGTAALHGGMLSGKSHSHRRS